MLESMIIIFEIQKQHHCLATPLCSPKWSSPDLHKLSVGCCMTSRGRLGEGVHVGSTQMSRDTDREL